MRRRKFITLIGGAAVTTTVARLPLRAQQTMPVVGWLSSAAPAPFAAVIAAFREALGKAGYAAGKTITIEERWAEGQYDRLPALAADLSRRANVIVASGGAVTVQAAKAAASTIPIVFVMGDDPIQSGLVASLNRPGGNVTGVSLLISQLEAKRLELLTELIPSANTIGLLLNPTNPNFAALAKIGETAAQTMRKTLLIANASNPGEIDAAFASAMQKRVGGLSIGTDIFFNNRREQIIRLAAKHSLPTVHIWREYVTEGGLASYGISHAEPYRQAAGYVARILKGEKPANLPVLQPTIFELCINLKTAKTLGLTVSPQLIARADEVIE